MTVTRDEMLSDINGVFDALDAAQAQVDTLTTQNASLATQVGTLTAQVADLQAQLNALQNPTPPPPPPTSDRPFLPYKAGAFFTSAVTPSSPIDPALTDSFRAFMASNTEQKATPYPLIKGVGGNKWGTVYAEARDGDPVWKLTGTVPADVAVLKTAGFCAPESLGAQLTGTSDSPFVVVDRVTGISVWAAKASVAGDHLITVGAAGFFQHLSNGLDKRDPLSDSTVNFRSRGAIPDAMVIRPDLMSWAIANDTDLGHVLHMFMVETDSAAGHVHPMVGHESGQSGWGAEGQRLVVRPDLDVSKASPVARVLVRTLQRHGAYIGDNAGGPTSLKAAQDDAAGSVWKGIPLTADTLKGVITWNDWLAVKPGWQ